MSNNSDRRDRRPASTSRRPGGEGGHRNLTAQISDGGVGIQVAPGVSVQVTSDTPAGTDGCTSGM